MPPRARRTRRSLPGSTAIQRSSAAGERGFASVVSRDLPTNRARAVRGVFPPEQVAEVKAIACELPVTHGLPLSRFTRTELHRLVVERGVTDASASTIWRWLHEDAIKPWQQRCWLFMRDPAFREKAGRVLDLYQRRFEGGRLLPDELVVCADEKSQLQALGRRHETVLAGRERPALVEFEYRRHGTLAYLAGWDVHHANLFDRVEPKTGIEPFGRPPAQTSTPSSPRSPSTNPSSRSRPNPPNFRITSTSRSRGARPCPACPAPGSARRRPAPPRAGRPSRSAAAAHRRRRDV